MGGVARPRRDLAGGDAVALHTDWLCDRLTDQQAAACERITRHQLDLTNAVLAA